MVRPPVLRRRAAVVALAAAVLAAPGALPGRPAHAQAPDCASCHAAEDPARAPLGATAAHRDLACASCHEPHDALAPPARRFARAPVEASPAGAGFDDETRLCAGCHFRESQWRGRGGGIVQHPVGVTPAKHDRHVVEPAEVPGAPAAAARGAETGASVPVAAPDSPGDDVLLPLFRADGAPAAGVIGCGTCHSLHRSPNAYQLRWAQAQEVTACSGCHDEAVAPLATER